MFINNIINVYNLINNLFFNFSNNYPPIKFNQFKYSQLMFLKVYKSALKYKNNYFCGTRINSRKLYFRERRE